MNETMSWELKKWGIISGVLLGFLVAFLGIFRFYYLTQMVTSPILIITGYFVFFPIVLPVGIAIYFIIKLRTRIGGYWSFKQAVRGIFIIFLTAYITQFLLNDILFVKLVEPNILDKTEKALINAAKTDFKSRKVSQKDIDQKVKEIQSNLMGQKKQATIPQKVQEIGISIIFLFVLSLLFAGFFRRELIYYNPDRGNEPMV